MSTHQLELLYFQSQNEFNHACASRITQSAIACVKKNGRFTLVLSGGRTPVGVFQMLASEFKAKFPFRETLFFLGDERMVPPTHPESNYKMAFDHLFSQVSVDPKNVYRFETESKNPEKAAAAYEAKIKELFSLKEGQFPSFDLALLGLGADGHTASLFPDSAALSETKRLVVSDFISTLNTFRLTMTVPVFNHCQLIFFLAFGSEKKQAAESIIHAKHANSALPATFIRPRHAQVTWFLNQS